MIEYRYITDFEKADMRQHAINGLQYFLNDLQIMLDNETDSFKISLLEDLIVDKVSQINAISSIN